MSTIDTTPTRLTDASGDREVTPVPWQGLNHLALITNDMDATVRFWHGVMGAPLIATVGTDGSSRCTVRWFARCAPLRTSLARRWRTTAARTARL